MIKILVIGESCLDIFQYGRVERISPEAPVPVFNPLHKTENIGMAGNVFRNLQEFPDVEVVLNTNENWREISKTRLVESKSNHMFLRVDENDDQYARCKMTEIKNVLQQYDAIILSDYDKSFLSQRDIQEIAKMHPKTFIDSKKSVGNWMKNLSFIKINNVEYKKAKNNIGKDVLQKLIVTLGPEGAMHNGNIYPVPKVEIRDVAGAGDVFLATFVVEYMRHNQTEQAIICANNAATRVVQQRGVSIL